MPRIVVATLLLLSVVCTSATEVALSNEVISVFCDLDSLQLSMKRNDSPSLVVSKGQASLGASTIISTSATNASWEYPSRGVRMFVQLEGERAAVHIRADRVGKVTFPVFTEIDSMKGWILPMFEGIYVPVGDVRWRTFLLDRGEMSTTADLAMPFVGVHFADRTVSCIVTNPFNNELTFHTNATGLEARLTHEFTRNQAVKEYGVVFQIGSNSPVEPAKHYREWLKERGEFVTLQDKIKQTPDAAKLIGAAHVYLWGKDLIDAEDVLDWKTFAKEFHTAAEAQEPSAARHLWALMEKSGREAVTNIHKAEWPDRYSKSLVIAELNKILLRDDFYDQAFWDKTVVGKNIDALLKKERSTLTTAERSQLNCHLLFTAFPKLLAPPEQWGNGVSPQMMKQLAEFGFDRLWVGASSWQGFVRRPETVKVAKTLGYLVGPYDSYHSIHSPDEPNTWDTAQFGKEPYETGGIVKADGTRRHGFQKKGFLFSPVAARPYVETRVNGLMQQFAANSWFIDCDGFGEFFDDYSEAHPATQLSDMQARLSRMAWIRDEFDAVIGTEGCSAGVASTVHFAHGVMTPVIGWGDPDLKDKQSKYFLGAYYPAEEPAVFFKPVAIKDDYRYFFYDPRFRLPLFQTVFHDSVIATHHWSNPSLKFPEVVAEIQLLELLYNVPPLYHLNRGEFQKRKAEIKQHYDLFSPMHRQLALLPMTDFRWLDEARTVQKSVFGGKVEVIANFSDKAFNISSMEVAPKSLAILGMDGSKALTYDASQK